MQFAQMQAPSPISVSAPQERPNPWEGMGANMLSTLVQSLLSYKLKQNLDKQQSEYDTAKLDKQLANLKSLKELETEGQKDIHKMDAASALERTMRDNGYELGEDGQWRPPQPKVTKDPLTGSYLLQHGKNVTQLEDRGTNLTPIPIGNTGHSIVKFEGKTIPIPPAPPSILNEKGEPQHWKLDDGTIMVREGPNQISVHTPKAPEMSKELHTFQDSTSKTGWSKKDLAGNVIRDVPPPTDQGALNENTVMEQLNALGGYDPDKYSKNVQKFREHRKTMSIGDAFAATISGGGNPAATQPPKFPGLSAEALEAEAKRRGLIK